MYITPRGIRNPPGVTGDRGFGRHRLSTGVTNDTGTNSDPHALTRSAFHLEDPERLEIPNVSDGLSPTHAGEPTDPIRCGLGPVSVLLAEIENGECYHARGCRNFSECQSIDQVCELDDVLLPLLRWHSTTFRHCPSLFKRRAPSGLGVGGPTRSARETRGNPILTHKKRSTVCAAIDPPTPRVATVWQGGSSVKRKLRPRGTRCYNTTSESPDRLSDRRNDSFAF